MMAQQSLVCGTVVVDSRPVYCRILTARSEPGRVPVLLLHGLGCSSAVWMRALDSLRRLGAGRLVVAADFPGSGNSEGPHKEPDIGALADWATRLLDRLEIDTAHIAAHSMGCQIALEMARRRPSRTHSLTLVGPTLGNTVVSPAHYMLGLAANLFLEPARFNCLLAKMVCQMGIRRCLESTFDFLRDRPLRHARAVACPVLVLRGERDVLIPDTAARKLAIALSRGEFERVPRTTHAVPFNRPDFFAARLTRFLDKVEEGSQPRESTFFQARLSAKIRDFGSAFSIREESTL